MARDFYIDKIKLLCVPAAKELQTLVEDRILWLDGEMTGKTWICGERHTLADIMLYCFMAFGASEGQSTLPLGNPNLAAWFDRVSARPSAKA